jgi:hypothetical protein
MRFRPRLLALGGVLTVIGIALAGCSTPVSPDSPALHTAPINDRQYDLFQLKASPTSLSLDHGLFALSMAGYTPVIMGTGDHGRPEWVTYRYCGKLSREDCARNDHFTLTADHPDVFIRLAHLSARAWPLELDGGFSLSYPLPHSTRDDRLRCHPLRRHISDPASGFLPGDLQSFLPVAKTFRGRNYTGTHGSKQQTSILPDGATWRCSYTV